MSDTTPSPDGPSTTETDFTVRRVELGPEWWVMVWVCERLGLRLSCFFGTLDPAIVLDLSRRPPADYLAFSKRLIDMRFADLSRITTETTERASRLRQSVADPEHRTVMLVQPGFEYGIGRAYQIYSGLRGRALQIATAIAEAETHLGVRLPWYDGAARRPDHASGLPPAAGGDGP